MKEYGCISYEDNKSAFLAGRYGMSDNKTQDNNSIDGHELSDVTGYEASSDLMEAVLSHYVNHHKVVLQKLRHAKMATLQGMEEIKGMLDSAKEVSDNEAFREIQKYDETWDQVIARFRESGVGEDELKAIENMLLSIPHAIKKYYDTLVKNDALISALLAELDIEKYEKACELVREVQERPNPMSGLGPEEYDAVFAKAIEKVQKAYKIYNTSE